MKDLTDPTNRDSVPAMLTPGEYVLNKEATEMYGPIIEQMNENGLAARAEGNMGVLSLNAGGLIWHKNYSIEVEKAIEEAAKKYGIPVDALKTLIYIESKGNPLAKNPGSSAKGIMQFIDSTAESYGLEDPYDLTESLDAGARLYSNNFKHLKKVLGRDPTASEMYLAHQQGATGALNILKSPNKNILDISGMTKEKVEKNGGNVNMTAQEFAELWTNKADKIADRINEPVLFQEIVRNESGVVDSSPRPLDGLVREITTNDSGIVDSSLIPKSRPAVVEVPQEVQADQIPTLPLQEQPVVMPQVPQQVQPSPMLEVPVQGHPDAGVFIPDFAPQQELIPNPSYSPPGTIKEESNPQLRNEIYLGPETNVRPLQIKNPTGEVPAEDADDGFSWSDYFRDAAVSTYNYLMPRQFEMQAVPSVAEDLQRDLYRRGPSQYVGGMVFNQGGPVLHLNPGGRAGGKKKVWDSATKSYIWVGPSDPRHPGNTPTVNEDRVPRVNPNPAPFTFDLTPNMPVRPGQSEAALPVSNTIVAPSPYEVPAMPSPMLNPDSIVVDSIIDAAPVPMSDEAILNTSSQVVEQREDNYPSNAQPGWRNLREGGQWQNPQAVPAPSPENIPMLDEDIAEANRLKYNAQLREYARQFPEGDPRRIEAFNNVLHQKGAAHPSYVNDRPIESGLVAQAPPVPPQPLPINYSQLSEDALITLSDDGDETASDEIRRRNDLVNVVDPIIEDQRNLGYTDLMAPGIHDSRPDIGNLGPGIYAEADHLGALSPGVIAELGPENVPKLDGTVIPSTHELALMDPSSPEALDALALADMADVNATVDFDDPRGPDQRQTVEQAQDSSQREAAVRNKVAEVDEGEGPAPNINDDWAASKGAEVIANNPAEESKAMSTIRGFFGDLFTADELKRAAVLFIGAMLTGATPGQALAFAGKDYLSRGEAHDKYVKELMEEGDHTTASIKAYSKSKNLGDLVPKQAMREGTGEYKTVFSPSGQRIRAMKVNVGTNQNIWVNAKTGERIPGYWNDNPELQPRTPEYRAAVQKAGENYAAQIKGLQRDLAGIEDSDQTITQLTPENVGGEIAKWAIHNNVDETYMPTIIRNAYNDLLADVKDGGKAGQSLMPYLQAQYVTAMSAGRDIFTLTEGDNAGERMSAEKISEVLTTAKRIVTSSGSAENVTDVQIVNSVLIEWNKLSSEEQSKYTSSDTETPFFKFLKEQINSAK